MHITPKIMTLSKEHARRAIRRRAGFTLVEMLVYVVILVIAVTVFVTSFVSILRAQASIQMHRETLRTFTIVTDRIVRDIRNADSIDVGSSVLGSSPGTLQLILDEANNTVTYSLSDGRVYVAENGGSADVLTPEAVTVTSLSFDAVSLGVSTGVRLEMDFIVDTGRASTTKTIADFAVLRGSY